MSAGAGGAPGLVDDWERMRAAVSPVLPSLTDLQAVRVWEGRKVHVDRGVGVPKLPVICRHDIFSNVWLMTGLGSRGLIHHALVAEHMAAAIRRGDVSQIPQELRM